MEWICNECGTENADDGKFCVTCGRQRPFAHKCICPVCQSIQSSVPGMYCEQCGHVFVGEDFLASGYDRAGDVTEFRDLNKTPEYTASDPPKNGKGSSGVVIIVVTALVVAGALAALFIVKYFDSDRSNKGAGSEPATTASVHQEQTAPLTSAQTEPETERTTEMPTVIISTLPPTLPHTTVPPTTIPPTTQPSLTTAPYVGTATTFYIRTNSGDSLSLREGPGTGTPKIMGMQNGATVYYTGLQENGFIKVNYTGVDYFGRSRTISGWAAGCYLVPSGRTQAPAYVCYQTDRHAGINMRSGSSANSGSIATLSEGTQVILLGNTDGDYTYVRTVNGGAEGWVMWRYLD